MFANLYQMVQYLSCSFVCFLQTASFKGRRPIITVKYSNNIRYLCHLYNYNEFSTFTVSLNMNTLPVDGGATSVELLVTASFKILSASFQWTDSTNLETALSRSELMEVVADSRLT